MQQTTTTAPSINEINASLLAQYQSAQKAKGGAPDSVQGAQSFASTLEAVEKQELASPTPLVGAKRAAQPAASTQAATATQTSVTKDQLLKEEAAACDTPKISRSARMACAEKATEISYADEDLGFDDLVDLVNPLQHIPIIGSIYRALTGDAIKPEVQVAGSVAFGLATGSVLLSAATGIASAAFEQNTGQEPTIQVADALFGSDTVALPDPVSEKKVVLADAGTVDPARTPAAAKAQSGTPTASALAATPSSPANAKTAVHASKETSSASLTTDGVVSSTGGMRVGNTIYTSPMLRNAAKVNTAKTVTVQPVTTSAAAQETAKSGATTLKADAGALGSQLQEQATVRASGQQLPPELVHDMMLMALDKYQSAAATTTHTASGTTTMIQ